MAGGPPYPTGGGFAALFSAGVTPPNFATVQKCRYHLRPALSRILAARSSPGIFNSWSCDCLRAVLLRPACLVSNQRGVDATGAAKNPRICTIYRTVINFCIAQFVACSVCAQSAKYHAILCCFALLRIGLYWRGWCWRR